MGAIKGHEKPVLGETGEGRVGRKLQQAREQTLRDEAGETGDEDQPGRGRRQPRTDGGSAVPAGRRGSAIGLPATRARGSTPAQWGSP